MHDLVIKGGTVYDGTGAAPVEADIAIDNGVIAAADADVAANTAADRHTGFHRRPHPL